MNNDRCLYPSAWLAHWGRDNMTAIFPDDIFICIFLNENEWHSIKISLKFVPKVPINIIPALVQIKAWRRPGDKPLSEPMMVVLPTHICVTRPQWANHKKHLIPAMQNVIKYLLPYFYPLFGFYNVSVSILLVNWSVKWNNIGYSAKHLVWRFMLVSVNQKSVSYYIWHWISNYVSRTKLIPYKLGIKFVFIPSVWVGNQQFTDLLLYENWSFYMKNSVIQIHR